MALSVSFLSVLRHSIMWKIPTIDVFYCTSFTILINTIDNMCFWRVQLSYFMILLQWHLFSVPRSLEVGSFSCNFSTRQHLTESQLNVPSSPDFLEAAESCFLATQAFTMHGHYIRYLHILGRPRVFLVYLEWSQLSLRNPKSSAHEPV